MEEAIRRARAECQMSNQATMSRRLARRMEGVISASRAKYFREFDKNGGFAMDGRGTPQEEWLLGEEDSLGPGSPLFEG